MSTATRAPSLHFKLHHRLALALEESGLSAEDMAAELGIHVNSVHNYAGGRRVPKLGMLKQWAACTGVDWEWIANGDYKDVRGHYVDQPAGTSSAA